MNGSTARSIDVNKPVPLSKLFAQQAANSSQAGSSYGRR
jgi:hypothetical protein